MNESLYRKAERIQHPVRLRERRIESGEIIPGSASNQVLQLLQSVYPQIFNSASNRQTD